MPEYGYRYLMPRCLCLHSNSFCSSNPSSSSREPRLLLLPDLGGVSYTVPIGTPKFNGTCFFKITPSTPGTSDARESAEPCLLRGCPSSPASSRSFWCCCCCSLAILASALSMSLRIMFSCVPSPGLGASVRGPVSPTSSGPVSRSKSGGSRGPNLLPPHHAPCRHPRWDLARRSVHELVMIEAFLARSVQYLDDLRIAS